jgi:hypothetical protein
MAVTKKAKSVSKREPSITFSFNGVLDIVQTRSGLQYRIYEDFQAAIRGGMDQESACAIFADRAQQAACSGDCQKQTVVGTNKIYCFDAGCGATSGCNCHLIERRRSSTGGTETVDLGVITKEKAIKPTVGSQYYCKCK